MQLLHVVKYFDTPNDQLFIDYNCIIRVRSCKVYMHGAALIVLNLDNGHVNWILNKSHNINKIDDDSMFNIIMDIKRMRSNLYNFQIYKLLLSIFWIFWRYNDMLQHYNTPLSQFVCDLVLGWCMLHTMYTRFDLNGYDGLYYWFHGGCAATTGEVYSS